MALKLRQGRNSLYTEELSPNKQIGAKILWELSETTVARALEFSNPGNWEFRLCEGQRRCQLTSGFYTTEREGYTKQIVNLGVVSF